MLWAPEHARTPCYAPARMQQDATDSELARAIAAGGSDARQAEALLCRRFGPRIRLYGLRHLRDDDRACDLVQAVLLGVLQAARAGRIEDVDKVDRFVLGTCRNTMLRMRETAGRTMQVSDDELLSVAAPPSALAEIGALTRCVKALDERAQQIVWLSFHEGHGASDVAAMLAMSPGSVRVARHRALLALRSCLDAHGNYDNKTEQEKRS